jgi:DNA-binding MarR family transcriptional regulator
VPDDPGEHAYQEAAELRRALRRFLHRSEEIARRFDLTPRQYVLLLMIRVGESDGGTTVGALVESLQLTQSTITELVHRAEEAGLIAREHSPLDGRVVLLSLTEVGRARLAGAFAELGPERQTLLQMLRGD